MAALSAGLGGCGIPTPVSIASYAADGVAYALSGKSVTDHALSAVLDEDCALYRLFRGRLVCHEEGDPSDEELYRALAEVYGPFSPLNSPYEITPIGSTESVGPNDGVVLPKDLGYRLAELPRAQRLPGPDGTLPSVMLATRSN